MIIVDIPLYDLVRTIENKIRNSISTFDWESIQVNIKKGKEIGRAHV